jgi:hypothetical protein
MAPPGAAPGGAPPGAPAPQAQQGLQGGAPSFGVGFSPGGRVRVNMAGGGFHPMALYTAVVSGRGFEKPRMMGLGFLGLSVLFFVVNMILIYAIRIYFPYFWALVPLFGWAGFWMAVTGQPLTQADGSPSPMWGRIGLAVCLALGLFGGIGMFFFF